MLNYRELRQEFSRKTEYFPVWPLLVFITALVLLIGLFDGMAHASDAVDMMKIVKIESNYNPRAFNKYSGARGYCQITPIVLKEFNQLRGERHGLDELYTGDFNIIVGAWYMNQRIPKLLKYHKIKDTVENRLWAYNAGIGRMVKGIKPRETRNYIKKYARLSE